MTLIDFGVIRSKVKVRGAYVSFDFSCYHDFYVYISFELSCKYPRAVYLLFLIHVYRVKTIHDTYKNLLEDHAEITFWQSLLWYLNIVSTEPHFEKKNPQNALLIRRSVLQPKFKKKNKKETKMKPSRDRAAGL